uniref:Uncharacterized protein n=1 Tax=Panagrolaimus superbus TaxID=310955 RepID=A0A914YPV9_9BILA
MFQKVDFVLTKKLSSTSIIKKINFGENLGFDLIFRNTSLVGNHFQIRNRIGDFEITKITTNYVSPEYDTYTRLFDLLYYYGDGNYKFYITANIKMKEMCVETRQIYISDSRLRLLNLYQYFKGAIDLDNLKLTYYVKKITENQTEIFIENPYDIEIEGVKG